ncbi:MAG: Gfo/Idh/MocA family oxidoreductase [Phycisphaerae bacterium]
MTPPTPDGMNRRRFLTTAAAAGAAGFAIVQAKSVRGSEALSILNLGLVGAGGRGRWIAKLFRDDGGYKVTATHDYFASRSGAAGKEHDVPEKHRFAGLEGYKGLIASGVDAVAIISPPYFHPRQAADAMEAGKHVYLAKPIAVDAPGCRSILASGKKATRKKQVFLVDFQTRADTFYIEALKRVHAGALGTFAFGESTYHANRIGKKGEDQTAEGRLRNWVFFKALSGDIITEQNIHTLDVMSWIMNTPPVTCWGTGGRKVRTDAGDCWDHFALTYQYPENVGIAFSSRQFNGHGTKPDGIRNRMFGAEGVLETQYGGEVLIRGKHFWRGGKCPGIYKEGAVTNIRTFAEHILAGKVDNPTVEPSVRSNLVTVMGRTAAYEGRVVTWDETVKSNETMEPDLSGLKA